jgi:hypothetical protein
MDTSGTVPITSEDFFSPQPTGMYGYNTDTLTSNYSTGTMRTVITLGSSDDLDTPITPIIFTPSNPNNNTVAFSYPVKDETKTKTKVKYQLFVKNKVIACQKNYYFINFLYQNVFSGILSSSILYSL